MSFRRPSPSLSKILLVVLGLASSLAVAGRPSIRQRVARAERAFDAGRYQEVIDRLAAVPRSHRLNRRATFLVAYAHFKLGRIDRAAALLDDLLEQRVDSRTALLRAMVAVESANRPAALGFLDQVTEEPWAESATRLRARVEAEQQREVEAERQRRAAAEAAAARQREAERQRTSRAEIERAKRAVETGDLHVAKAALDRAESLWPGQLVTRYYRGLLAYRQGQYRRAEGHLRQALAIDADDGWSRYMLALSIDRTGRSQRARQMLGLLASRAPEPDLRRVARQALSRMRRPRRPDLELRLDLRTGVDSNPSYLDEVALDDPAMALQLGLHLDYRRRLAPWLEVMLGAAFVERAYVAGGGEEAHHTEPRGWVGLALPLGRLRLQPTYQYALLLYGHEALLSTHTGELSAAVALTRAPTALSLELTGWTALRRVHDDDYAYLDALRAGATLALTLDLRWATLALGYGVDRDWADPVETTFAHQQPGTNRAMGPGRMGETFEIVYRTDYSLIEHGPMLQASLELPWRLSFSVAAYLELRRFDHADAATRSDTGTGTTLEARRDLRLAAEARLRRDLPAGLSLALRWASMNNGSTVDSPELDRNFARHLAELVLAWTWPVR
jgi:tetratricopeptide (TPR) repeat protein